MPPARLKSPKLAQADTPTVPPPGTLYDFFKSVKPEPVKRPRRLLTAKAPPPRKSPLSGGKSNPPVVSAVLGAAESDRLRRYRPRGIAAVHPTGARIDRTILEFSGARNDRVSPLLVEDLWDSPHGPPYVAGSVSEEFQCGICLQLKSHPVSYTCGHSHCYSCIRVWLEEQWSCPDCRAIITVAPFRVYAEERHIARHYGNWDTSRHRGAQLSISLTSMYPLCPDGALSPRLLRDVLQGHGRHFFPRANFGIDYQPSHVHSIDTSYLEVSDLSAERAAIPFKFVLFGEITTEAEHFRGWPGRLVLSLGSPNWANYGWSHESLDDEFISQVYSLRYVSMVDRRADEAVGKKPMLGCWVDNSVIKLEIRPSSVCEYSYLLPGGEYASSNNRDITFFPYNAGDTVVVECSLHRLETERSNANHWRGYSLVVSRIKRVKVASPDNSSPSTSETLDA
ncbi:hypothetical protein C8R43DRAFT_1133836 [Mycena crocata]|nr:hypothetical protein C8R43DRAFT_1133836 [Mycena crocata]